MGGLSWLICRYGLGCLKRNQYSSFSQKCPVGEACWQVPAYGRGYKSFTMLKVYSMLLCPLLTLLNCIKRAHWATMSLQGVCKSNSKSPGSQQQSTRGSLYTPLNYPYDSVKQKQTQKLSTRTELIKIMLTKGICLLQGGIIGHISFVLYLQYVMFSVCFKLFSSVQLTDYFRNCTICKQDHIYLSNLWMLILQGQQQWNDTGQNLVLHDRFFFHFRVLKHVLKELICRTAYFAPVLGMNDEETLLASIPMRPAKPPRLIFASEGEIADIPPQDLQLLPSLINRLMDTF